MLDTTVIKVSPCSLIVHLIYIYIKAKIYFPYFWICKFLSIPLQLSLIIIRSSSGFSIFYKYPCVCCTLRTSCLKSSPFSWPSLTLSHLVTLKSSPIILRALALISAPSEPRLYPCQRLQLCVCELALQAPASSNRAICRGLMLLIKLQMLTTPSQAQVASIRSHERGSRTARCPAQLVSSSRIASEANTQLLLHCSASSLSGENITNESLNLLTVFIWPSAACPRTYQRCRWNLQQEILSEQHWSVLHTPAHSELQWTVSCSEILLFLQSHIFCITITLWARVRIEADLPFKFYYSVRSIINPMSYSSQERF